MKSTSKITKYDLAKALSFITLIVMVIQTLIYKNGFFELTLIAIGSYSLGFMSRLPHTNERTLLGWYKILTLKLKIGILKKNLKPFTDLRKYKHKSEAHIREMVIEWRLELKELKRELSNILKS